MTGEGGGSRGSGCDEEGGGSLGKQWGLLGIPVIRKQASAQMSMMWSNPTYLYFKTNFLGGGIFENSQHVVKVRQFLGIGFLLPKFHHIKYEESPNK